MKQLLAEKQKLQEKAGPELQLIHRLLANGKFRSYVILRGNVQVNPLTPELNPSAQCCVTRFLLGIFLLEPCISLIYA
jgi:hypothetical protein